MLLLLRATILALAAIGLLAGTAATAQGPVKQLKLTEKQVEAFIAAHADKAFADLIEKLLGPKPAPEPKALAELDAAAARHGFKSYAEYVDVFNSIGVAMNRIDPQTKALVDPEVEIRKEIAEITADKTIAEAEKKQMLEELDDALKSLQPVEHASNIDLVLKHHDKLKDLL
jgi:hypothetical protein